MLADGVDRTTGAGALIRGVLMDGAAGCAIRDERLGLEGTTVTADSLRAEGVYPLERLEDVLGATLGAALLEEAVLRRGAGITICEERSGVRAGLLGLDTVRVLRSMVPETRGDEIRGVVRSGVRGSCFALHRGARRAIHVHRGHGRPFR